MRKPKEGEKVWISGEIFQDRYDKVGIVQKRFGSSRSKISLIPQGGAVMVSDMYIKDINDRLTQLNLKIYHLFQLTKNGIVYHLINYQGLGNCVAYIESVNSYNTRCNRKSKRHKMISSKRIVYEVIDTQNI